MFKKIIIITLLLLSCRELFAEEVEIYFNEKLLKFSHSITEKNGRTYVPLRDIVEELKGDIYWDSLSQNIIVLFEDNEIKFRTGFKQAKVNGKWVPLEMPALRIDNIVFVPLRFIGETFGAKITWDRKEAAVFIEYSFPHREEPLFEVTHNAAIPLSLGETFLATFKGPDRGKVFIRATDYDDNSVFFSMPMKKKSTGLYEATYEIKEGDLLKGGKLVVTSIDKEGSKQFIKAPEPVYINTGEPVIKKTFPGEGGFVSENFSAVYILFDLKEGSIINGDSLFLSINDKDISSKALITDNMILYKLPSPLKIGENTVQIIVSDRNGNEIKKIWNFWVVK